MKRITAAMVDAARKRAAEQIAGTYRAEPPRKAARATRFMPRVTPRPRELAVRNKQGSRVGPR